MSENKFKENDITQMCDALANDIEQDGKRIVDMYAKDSVSYIVLSKAYIRSKMIVEEAKTRWIEQLKAGKW